MAEPPKLSEVTERRRFLKDAATLGFVATTLPFLTRVPEAKATCPPAAPSGIFTELRSLDDVLKVRGALRMTAIKGVDLSTFDADYWRTAVIDRTYFLGCRFAGPDIEAMLQQRGGVIFPRFGRPSL